MMHHILVVEDESHLGIGIKFNLEAEGYRVTLIDDGPTALEKIRDADDPVDLVVLDLMLPGMSGYHVCESIRESGNQVPVLMLSARKLPEDRARGFDVGADQYLMKPFDLDELISRIRRLLATRAGAPPANAAGDALYEFGSVRVNLDTYQATIESGDVIALTALEMKLLRYFISNANRVVSREELLENVWEIGGSPTTRTVDNFISRLRKYFEPDPAKPVFLLSVRGAGYRFVPDGEDAG